MPAFFLMLRACGLQNTLTGLAVAYSSFTLPFTVWIMKSYFETIPRDLEGSGLVDGCTRLQVYRRIVLPMSGPGLVAFSRTPVSRRPLWPRAVSLSDMPHWR